MSKRDFFPLPAIIRPDRRFANHRGVAIVEFALTVVFIITLLGWLWTLLTVEDFRQSIFSAGYASFNNKLDRLYSRDSLGNTILWNDTTVGAGVLDDVRTEFQSRVVAGSGYSALAPVLLCEVRVGYLTLNNGRVTNTAPIVTPPTSGFTGDLAKVMQLIDTAAAQYQARMLNRFLLPNDAIINTNAEYQAPYIDSGSAIDPASAPSPTQIYFPWSSFFVWGCILKRRVLGLDFSEDSSGIFVPNRNLL